MKKILILGLCLSTTLFSGCSLLGFSDRDKDVDVYESVGKNDVLNDSKVNFTQRVSHIVTFEFDSVELPLNTAEVVEPHVRYLVANPNYKIALQGNASNEGSRSYNYALAKKRVDAVESMFLDLGIEGSQIVKLSVGKTQDKFSPKRSVLIVY
jgi:peptidoglycan-associated lipoprotein